MAEAREFRAGLLAAALGTLPFLPSLRAGFALDDTQTVLTHPGVRGAFSLREIWLRDFWGNPWWAPNAIGTWRPLVTLTYAIDRHLGGGATVAFHATNLVLYALLLFLVDRFLATWLTALSTSARAATVVAFGVLAIHGDVVPSVTGRAEILAMLGGVLALWVAVAPARRAAHYALFVLGAAIALASKESALPVVLFAGWLAARRSKEGYGIALAAIVCVVAYLVYRIPRIPTDTGFYLLVYGNPLITASFGARIAGAFEALTHYLQHLAAPIDLLADYSYAVLLPGSVARAVVGVAIVAAATVGFVRARKTAPELAEAIVGLFASYIVVSHFLLPSRQFVADRNFFFPSLFVVVIVALLLSRAAVRVRLVAVAALVVVVAQAVFAVFGTLTWRSSASLAEYSVRTAPNSELFRRVKGDTALMAGDMPTAAWSFLVGAAIEARFPARVPEETFPAEWEDLAFEARLAAFRARIGPDEARAARDRAVRALESNGVRAPAQLLRRWNP